MYKSVLIVSDNEYLLKQFELLIEQKQLNECEFNFSFSESNKEINRNILNNFELSPIDLKIVYDELISRFDLIISLHCKQIFPAELVRQVKCINVHPGLNPYNRGWLPQVFSIINKLPFGATIHEMDEMIDHGAIIARREVELSSWDTALTAHNKVLAVEIELLRENISQIISGEYKTTLPESEGNFNTRKDFQNLCALDLAKTGTFEEHIDILRALSNGEFKNAYFTDASTGKRVHVKIELTCETKIDKAC